MNEDKFVVGARRLAEYDAMDQHELGVRMLTDFKTYVDWIHLQAFGCPFVMEPVHFTIIQALQDFADGKFKTKNLAINVCPGIGKSTLVQYWISWCFARCRSSMFLYVNAVESVVKELSSHTRDLLLLPAWQKIYGVEIDNTRLSGAQTSKIRWSLKSGGLNSGLIAKTLSSTILGLSAGNPNADGFPGCLLIDDPEGTDTITQEYQRNQVHSIYSQGLKSRRRGTHVGTVLIQQRLHIEDLTGWLKEVEADDPDDTWTFISVPALYQKENGEWASACSRIISVSELQTMREKDPYKFYSMYQQEPITLGGNYFHEDDFRYYTELPEMQTTFVSTDFAFKKEENYDRTVFLHWGLGIDNKLYLLNWDLFREDVLGVKKRFVEFMKKCREQYPLLSTVVVEKSVANTAFLPDLVAEHPYFNFIPFSKSGMNNKVMFIKASREFFISEKVWFPKSPKPTDLIKETLMFSIEGTAPHDDAPDAMALGIHYIFSNLEMNSLFI